MLLRIFGALLYAALMLTGIYFGAENYKDQMQSKDSYISELEAELKTFQSEDRAWYIKQIEGWVVPNTLSSDGIKHKQRNQTLQLKGARG